MSTNPISTLWRVSEFDLNSFSGGWAQLPAATPQVYSQSVTSPVTLQLSPPPAVIGMLEMLLVKAGPTINLSVASQSSVLGIPDDFSWGIKYGALADLLSGDGQAKDPERAAYCEARYQEAVQVARTFPSVLQAQMAGVPIFIGSVYELDTFSPGWENAASVTFPTAVGLAGRNLVALSPPPSSTTFGPFTADVVGNMPVPQQDSDYLQVPVDLVSVILDFAQHLASFKMGGQEFAGTQQLRQNFLNEAANYNERLRQLDFYNDALRSPAHTEEAERPRIQSPILTVSKGPV